MASQKGKAGSSVSDLIMKAASAADASTGVSLASLRKALKAGGYDVDLNRARIITALKRLVAQNYLVQVKGTGVSGSFKVNSSLSKPGRKKVAQKKKSAVKKVKWSGVRNAATAAAKKKTARKTKKARKPKLGRPTWSLRSADKK